MLQDILNSLHNYFIASTHDGVFIVSGGVVVNMPTGILTGQYVMVEGSVLNDGVHLSPGANLKDETFTGTIHGLSIPPDLIRVADEIESWVDNPANKPGVMASESFGGYNYSRATNKNGVPLSWEDVFASKLNRWRRL